MEIKVGKRKYTDLQQPYSNIGTQRTNQSIGITEKFIFSNSLKTGFLTPNNIINFDEETYLFSKKIERQIEGSAQTYFPDISDEDAIIFLEIVQEIYKDAKIVNKVYQIETPKFNSQESKVNAAIGYLTQGTYSYSTIAALTGLNKNKVARLSKQLKPSSYSFSSLPKRSGKLQSQHLQFLTEILSKTHGPDITLKLLQSELIEKFEELKTISLTTIREAITKLGFSFKKAYRYPERRNDEYVKKLRSEVVKKLVYSLFEPYKVIFIDETAFQLNLSRNYGWAKRGKRVLLSTSPQPKTYSAIVAITGTEVLGCQLIKGGVKKEDYLAFVAKLLDHYQFIKEKTPVVIFVDNASIHTAKTVRLSLDHKVTILHNAPHSPMLNPIEEFFSKFKYFLQKKPTQSEEMLIQSVQEVLTMFQPCDFHGYLRHVLSYVKAALNMEDILS